MSDYTTTPNLGLFKPTVDADLDQWGNHWNTNADTLDTKLGAGAVNGPYVPLAGNVTMSGPLSLSSPPTLPLQVSTKGYVDSTVVQPATVAPGMDGTATVGASLLYARQDHLHPTDSTRAPVASPVLTGNPQSVTPVTTDSSTSIATTAFVKAAIASGASITVSDTAPASPAANALWWDSVGTQLYLWYNDGTSSQWVNATNAGGGSVAQVSDTPPSNTLQGLLWWDSVGAQLYMYYNDGTSSQWVPTINQSGLLAEAPTDSQLYGRQNSTWQPVPNTTGNVGRSYIHNGTFQVQQRGSGPFTAAGVYTADRWLMSWSVDTNVQVYTPVASDGTRAGIGDEAAQFFLQVGTTGSAAANAYTLVLQPIENVRRLSNKTVIVSFYAVASAAGLKLGVAVDQSPGSGGSPSAFAPGVGQAVTLTASWARYSLTFNVPSTSGMTLGTNGNSSTSLNFWFSSSSTYATRSGNIGAQTGTFYLWGVQLEIAAPGQTAPSPLEKIEYGDDLRHCMRFFSIGRAYGAWYGTAGMFCAVTSQLATPMRAGATMVITNNNCTNIGSAGINVLNAQTAYITGAITGTGGGTFDISYTASADL